MKTYVQFHQLISGKSRDERRRHDYFTPIPLMLCSPTCGVETIVDDTDILLNNGSRLSQAARGSLQGVLGPL